MTSLPQADDLVIFGTMTDEDLAATIATLNADGGFRVGFLLCGPSYLSSLQEKKGLRNI